MFLILITGPSGCGKSTLIKWLVEKNVDISLAISHTTRKMRNNERDGVDYFFISKDCFLKKIETKQFYEWAQYDENYYGTSFSELFKNEIVILDVEREGSKKFNEYHTCKIFLTNSKDVIAQRLNKRYNFDQEKVQRRLKAFEKDIEHSRVNIFNHIITTDNFENNCKQLEKIIRDFISNVKKRNQKS